MIRKARALVGYLTREAALPLLLGGHAAEPGIDLSPQLSQWERARREVEERAPIELVNPTVETPRVYASRIEQFRQRPDVIQAFAPHDWTVGAIDLRHSVLSYQTIVHTEDAIQRVSEVDLHDPEAVFDACLPQAEKVELPGGFDQSQNAFTISSLNPNLRIASFELVEAPLAGGQTKRILGFTLSLGSSHVQVVEYRGRWMVRDGYHRLYGLLSRGATVVPCVIIRARTFEETGAGRPGFFGFETLYSDRPPRLSDFADTRYSVEVTTPAVRKVVRIRGEEFVVPV